MVLRTASQKADRKLKIQCAIRHSPMHPAQDGRCRVNRIGVAGPCFAAGYQSLSSLRRVPRRR